MMVWQRKEKVEVNTVLVKVVVDQDPIARKTGHDAGMHPGWYEGSSQGTVFIHEHVHIK